MFHLRGEVILPISRRIAKSIDCSLELPNDILAREVLSGRPYPDGWLLWLSEGVKKGCREIEATDAKSHGHAHHDQKLED